MGEEKESLFIIAANEVVKDMIAAYIEYFTEFIEPISMVADPEKLVGAPYSQWKDNPEILQQLSQVYGTQEPNPLSELIFKESMKEIRELEGEG